MDRAEIFMASFKYFDRVDIVKELLQVVPSGNIENKLATQVTEIK